jgi:hypothetical protein
VVAQLRLKLAMNKAYSQRITRKKFNIEKLKHEETRKEFKKELKKSLDHECMADLNPSEHWTVIKETMFAKSENILGTSKKRQSVEWISEETWNEVKARKDVKQNNNADDTTRTILVAEYSELNKRVKRSARRDKRAWADKLAHIAQLAAAEAKNVRELYQVTKQLAWKPFRSNQTGIRDATGCMLASPQDQLNRWQE